MVPRGILSHLQLHSIDEFATFITLVPPGLLVAAEGARALHKAVGQEPLAALTAQLLHRVLQQETTGQQALEDVLGNPGTGEEEEGAAPINQGTLESTLSQACQGSPQHSPAPVLPCEPQGDAATHMVCCGVVVRPK